MTEKSKRVVRITVKGSATSGAKLIANLIAAALADAGVETLHDGVEIFRPFGGAIERATRTVKELHIDERARVVLQTGQPAGAKR